MPDALLVGEAAHRDERDDEEPERQRQRREHPRHRRAVDLPEAAGEDAGDARDEEEDDAEQQHRAAEDDVGDRRVRTAPGSSRAGDDRRMFSHRPAALGSSWRPSRPRPTRDFARTRPRRASSSSVSSSSVVLLVLVLLPRRPRAPTAVAALVADGEAAEDVLERLRVAVQLEQHPALVGDELEDLGAEVDVLLARRARRRARARRSAARSPSSRRRPCRARPRPRAFLGSAPLPRYVPVSADSWTATT